MSDCIVCGGGVEGCIHAADVVKLAQILNVSITPAAAVAQLLSQSRAPKDIDQAEEFLLKISDLIGGSGVESLPYPDTYHDEPICLYVNTGDTWSRTIVWDGVDFRLSSGWGAELEFLQEEEQ